MKSKPELWMTVGLPYSGKSNWAINQGFPVVCPDKIRLALHAQRYEPLAEPMVWAIAKVMVRALFYAGHAKVILDATNTTSNRRDDWQSDDWVRKYLICDICKEACIQRARKADDEYIVDIIERMAGYLDYDGILYGEDGGIFMEDRIQNPDGSEALQIYHSGRAEDDIA